MTQSFRLYEPGQSFLYLLDPRVKVVGVLAVFLMSVLFTSPYVLGPIFGLLTVVMVAGRVPLRRVGIFLRSLTVLVGISLIMWPLIYHRGPVIAEPFGVSITLGGLEYGIGMTFRILNMVVAPIALFLTTTQPDFVVALRRLGLPYKASFALATSFRFLPTVVGVGTSIVEAQRARGLDPSRGSPIARIRSYARILGPLMITSIRIAQQLILAVEARAFSIDRPRSSYRVLQLQSRDMVALALIGLACAITVGLRVAGYGLIA